jgi:hypothetical protein
MWVPGSIPFAAAFIVFVYRWLGETAQDGQRAASPLVPLLISRPARSCVGAGAPVGGVDRRGFQRTGYLFAFLPNFVALDLRSLGRKRA